MKHLLLTMVSDITESLRARWFIVYTALFGGLVALLFVFGISESRILGFMGLSRLLTTYIQLCMAILLSLPIGLGAWYWGKLLGRFVVIFLPVFLAMLAAAAWGQYQQIPVPWAEFAYYTALLLTLAWCFLGIGMLLSSLARSADVAQGAAFIVWLTLVLFLDIILLGVMIKEHLPHEAAVMLSLANPLQVFRTAGMMLFDRQLVLLGPSAYVILDNFGQVGYMVYALAYPIVLGTLFSVLGYLAFRRGDLP